ncbi:hypothetical protein L1999_14595 [Neobacillus drentensis]|uniref:hypothetical protein n=1 Tax=Neobacillus drentensis TaxID=220684 RepID=UPI001F320418|nr:hypothetical protein [Neobacillus drentensis]ULT54404.1 hypothetical protein L1999_14595 [Neobacillus drentensis]
MSTHTGFLPSSSGFKFGNNFPPVPLKRINVLGRHIPIGNASYGLCGGMIYAAMDYFEATMPIPTNPTAPSSGALFDYIVYRQIDSFDIPFGLMKYMVLMNPFLRDDDPSASRRGGAPQGSGWKTMNEEWPKIKNDLDNGKLSPLGLIRVKSINPFAIRRHHQVLAYGYDLHESHLSIFIYDPNFPNDDDVTLTLNRGTPESTTSVFHSKSSEPIYRIFKTEYKFKSPVDIK